MKNLSRRNRMILYVITIMLLLSMIISAVVAFTPTTQNPQNVSPTVTQVP